MNVKLAKLMVEKGYLSLDNLKTAVEEQKNTDKSLGIILINHGFITEKQLLEITNFENQFEIIDLSSIDIPEDVIKLIPKNTALNNNLIPFELNGSFLSVAMFDPSNIVLIDELRFLTGFNIKPYISEYSGIKNALSRYYAAEFDTDGSDGSKVEEVQPRDIRPDDLSVTLEEEPQLKEDTDGEVSAAGKENQGLFVEEELIEEKQAEPQNIVSSSGQSKADTTEDEGIGEKSDLRESKPVDRIDIFRLSPDEIEESKSYGSNKLKDNEKLEKADSDIQSFQSPKVTTPDVSAGNQSNANINNESLFQAPPQSGGTMDDDFFQTPQKVSTPQTEISNDMFQAPTNQQPEESTEAPFIIEAKEPETKVSLQSDDAETDSITGEQGVPADPFSAFSGVNEPIAVELHDRQGGMADNGDDNVEHMGFEVQTEESGEKVEFPQIENNDQPFDIPVQGFDSSQTHLSVESDDSKTVLSGSPADENTGKLTEGVQLSPGANMDVDNSYDYIESLNEGLEQSDVPLTSGDVDTGQDILQPSSDNKQDTASVPDNGSYNEIKRDNENILQLEEDSVEEDEDLVRPTVLVVDDSPTVQKIVSVTLNRRGYNVEVSSNAMQALAKLNECIPDIIFLDINLPHMDGYQLCKVIKSNELTKSIPVVFLSGKDGFFDKMRGKMVGATDYITKPFEPKTLISALEKQGISIARTA